MLIIGGGSQGPQGVQGNPGANGAPGAQGIAGPPGGSLFPGSAAAGAFTPNPMLTLGRRGCGASVNVSGVVGSIIFIPFTLSVAANLKRISMRCSAASGAGALFRFGIYDADPASLLPRNLLIDAGQFAGDVANTTRETSGLNIALSAGVMLWGAVICGVSATGNFFGIAVADLAHLIARNSTDVAAAPGTFIQVAQAFGALPAAAPATDMDSASSGNVPAIFLGFVA